MPAICILPHDKDRALHWLEIAPPGTRLEFRKPVRSLPQNDRMWAMLTELSVQLTWHGQKLSPEDWKDVVSAGLKREVRMVPNMDNDGFVAIGMRTSTMSKEELGDLMELIAAFGARNGVTFHDDAPPPAGDPPKLAADMSKADDATVLAWSDVFEAALKGARPFEVAEYWGAAHNGGRLAQVRRVSQERFEALKELMTARAAERSAA